MHETPNLNIFDIKDEEIPKSCLFGLNFKGRPTLILAQVSTDATNPSNLAFLEW